MHYKQNPECLKEEKTILPPTVTLELIQQHLGFEQDPYINIKFCAKCPKCNSINPKRGKSNLLICTESNCKEIFCYICNKTISGPDHYKSGANCHANSEPWHDIWRRKICRHTSVVACLWVKLVCGCCCLLTIITEDQTADHCPRSVQVIKKQSAW